MAQKCSSLLRSHEKVIQDYFSSNYPNVTPYEKFLNDDSGKKNCQLILWNIQDVKRMNTI